MLALPLTLFLWTILLMECSQAFYKAEADPNAVLWGTPEHIIALKSQDHLLQHPQDVYSFDRPPYSYDRENLTFSIDVVYAASQDGVSPLLIL